MSENNHIEELIIRYLQDDVSAEELLELENWVMASSEHKALFFQMKQIADSSRRFPWSDAEKEKSWQRMRARISVAAEREKALPLSVRRRFGRGSWMKYAAMFAVVLTLGWGIGELITGLWNGNMKNGELVYNTLQTERGGRSNTLILSDGTKVILNAATNFRYSESFKEGNRTVYLDGEAYFEVAKDEEHPFVVKLKQQDITVLGTVFNVEAYSDDPFCTVTLLSGSVSLDTYNENGETISRMFLKPNQQAVTDNQFGSVSIQQIDPTLADSWTRGKYKFKDEALPVIIRRLEKYYDVQFHIECNLLKQMKFTGTFSLDQDIQEILHVLDHENLYAIKRIGKEIFIVKK